jgi:DNA-binding CsgD family transcriptional regulator
MWLYSAHGIKVELHILMNTFMYTFNVAVAGFCISRKHAYISAGMYILLVGPLLFIEKLEYISRYAPFILYLLATFSIALAEFVKLLERFFADELKYKDEIYNKNHELADQQKRFLRMELESKNKEIMCKVMFLLNQAENNSSFIKELNELKSDLKANDRTKLERIIQLHRLGNNEKYWSEFEKSYIEVNDNFYYKLHSLFPALSPAESRLAALIHLGLTSKQIASLLSNTPESIDVARSRLRSKLNLSVDTNLSSYLRNF